jgi:multidrug efflux pump
LLKLGIPAGINSGLMSISTIFLNNILLIYGNSAVAAMGIVTKIYLLIALIHMGIANGIQPLLGYCYGAKLKKRFMDIMKFSLKFSISIGLILTVIYIVFSKEIIELFIQDREVIEYGAKMLVATSLAGPILGVMFLSINGMQAINNPLPATVLSLARQGLLFIPLLFVMNSFLGLTGVNFTQTVADYISIVIGVFLFINSLKKVKE